MDTLGRSGHPVAKAKFDDFIIGFNQAAERFLMVDVGSAKEAADAKIKGMYLNATRDESNDMLTQELQPY